MAEDDFASSFSAALGKTKLYDELIASIREVDSVSSEALASAEQGSSGIIGQMIKLIDSTDATKRVGALQAIAIIGRHFSATRSPLPTELRAAERKICDALECDRKDMRQEAVRALGVIAQATKDKDLVTRLLQLASSEPDSGIAIEAITAIGECGEWIVLAFAKQVSELLRNCPHDEVRCAACDVLGRTGKPASIMAPTLIELLLLSESDNQFPPKGCGNRKSSERTKHIKQAAAKGASSTIELRVAAARALCRVDPQAEWLLKEAGLDQLGGLVSLLVSQGESESAFAKDLSALVADLRRGPQPGYKRMQVSEIAEYVFSSRPDLSAPSRSRNIRNFISDGRLRAIKIAHGRYDVRVDDLQIQRDACRTSKPSTNEVGNQTEAHRNSGSRVLARETISGWYPHCPL